MAGLNVLAIDYGAKRIGLALGSEAAKLATPLDTIEASEGLTDQLGDIVTANDVGRIVIGLPRNLEGEDTAQTAAAREFAALLESSLGLPVTLQDEALTSQEAADRLKSRYPGKIEPGLIDREAAAIILQDYFNSL
jgi:putative holliday junction resolvase